MGCCECLTGTIFGLITLVTVGLTTVSVIGLVVYAEMKHAATISTQLSAILISTAVVAGFIFLFAMYAAWCGKACAKVVLGIVFLCYATGLFLIGWFMLTSQDSILETCKKFWTDETAIEKKVYEDIETAFECTCWDEDTCVETVFVTGNGCGDKLKDLIDRLGKISAAVCFGFGALLVIVAGLAIGFACFHRDQDEYSRHAGFRYVPY